MTIVVEPDAIKADKNSIAVTYTITAKNNSKGVYALYLYFCGLQPLVIGLNESQVDPVIFNKYFTAVYDCPSMNSDPDLKITGYSGILHKNIQINSIGLDSTHPSAASVPEFPYAMLLLVTSFVSLIIFYRIKFR